jgi:hypothetical protein
MATFNGDTFPITGEPAMVEASITTPLAQGYTSTSGTGTASIIYYLWRAFDATLNRTVYWYATSAVSAAAQGEYTEGAGPLSDVHLIKRKQ